MRNLSVKLEEMKKAGPKNVRIKYIRNVPTIVEDGKPKQGTEPANGRKNGASHNSHVSNEDSSTNNVSALENQNDLMYNQREDNSEYTKSNNHIEFERLRAAVIRKSRIRYHQYIDEIENNVSSNIKNFWNFANKSRKKLSNPKNVQLDEELASDDLVCANLFAKYFKSFYKNPTGDLPDMNDDENCINIDLNIEPLDILEKI
ncbi:hypothetical protein QAD02_007668 [Eretmocerus hayati]|uniref:Uncharacterized protein n=1 Tax=Eretmocerus hayati TaxID=131215 RepID=A0ACC2N4K2_9HYME|nr:hypothetical protein QAD02_007668 [Eretmocerus hayati]